MKAVSPFLLVLFCAFGQLSGQSFIGVPDPYKAILSAEDTLIGKKGVNFYSKLIKQNSSDAEAWFGKGMAYAYIGDSVYKKEQRYYRKARCAFFKATRKKQNFAEAYFRIGLCHQTQVRELRATLYFSKAIKKDSTKPIYYYYRGISCDLDREGKDLLNFSKAISLDSTFVNAYLQRAYYYKISGDKTDLENAMRDYNKVIYLTPGNITIYCLRAEIWTLQNDWASALGDYDTAIKIRPNSPVPYEFRAHAKFERGDNQGACDDWYKADSLRSKHAKYYIKDNCTEAK
jgi:tetratricopeptide (TPR) repeat protein